MGNDELKRGTEAASQPARERFRSSLHRMVRPQSWRSKLHSARRMCGCACAPATPSAPVPGAIRRRSWSPKESAYSLSSKLTPSAGGEIFRRFPFVKTLSPGPRRTHRAFSQKENLASHGRNENFAAILFCGNAAMRGHPLYPPIAS